MKGQLYATHVDLNNLFTDLIVRLKFLTINPEIVTLVFGDLLITIGAKLEIPAARTSGKSESLIL